MKRKDLIFGGISLLLVAVICLGVFISARITESDDTETAETASPTETTAVTEPKADTAGTDTEATESESVTESETVTESESAADTGDADITSEETSQAEETTKKAEETTKKAEETTKKAEETTKAPEETTKKAEETTKEAEETTKADEETTSEPESTEHIITSTKVTTDFLDFDTSSYARNEEDDIKFVMIHFTSAVVLNSEMPYDYKLMRSIFEDYDIGIHYYIDRDGTVYCWLPEERVAWHAGNGNYKGQYENTMNRHSIGIELAGMGTEEEMQKYITSSKYASIPESNKGFTEKQYAALAVLVDDICQRYGLEKTADTVIGHCEYNSKKVDPGVLFDWSKIGITKSYT